MSEKRELPRRNHPDWISTYLDYTKETEPREIFHAWCAVSVIAAALQRKCYAEWGSDRIYPNMYIALAGPPGARKSYAMRFAEKFITSIGVPTAANAVTKEALVLALKEAELGSYTSQIGRGITPTSSLTVFNEELVVFLGADPELLRYLCNWFDCPDVWRKSTKTQGDDDLNKVWLNLLGGITPELIRTALPRDTIGGGLVSRMIFVYEEDKRRDIAFDHTDPELFETLRQDLETVYLMQGRFVFSTDLIEKYIDWYEGGIDKRTQVDAREFAGYNSRRASHLRKLCLIMSASRSNELVIRGVDFENALALLSRTEEKMALTFSGFGEARTSNVQDNIMAFIAQRRVTTIPELLKYFYKDIESAQQLVQLLDMMRIMGFCEVDNKTSPVTVTFTPDKIDTRGFGEA